MSQLFIPDGAAAWSVLSLMGAGYRLAVGRQVGASVPAVAPHRALPKSMRHEHWHGHGLE